jgi:hypothetical protein
MASVYTFYQKNSQFPPVVTVNPSASKAYSTSLPSASNTSVSSATNAPSGQTSQMSEYKFQSKQRIQPQATASEPAKEFNFSEDLFPALQNLKSSNTENKSQTKNSEAASCWANKQVIEVIKKPFAKQLVVPKKQIPPLFSVKKHQKNKYNTENDDYELDEEERNYLEEPENLQDPEDDYYDDYPGDDYYDDWSEGDYHDHDHDDNDSENEISYDCPEDNEAAADAYAINNDS